MSKKKFSFIFVISDEEVYEESRCYLNRLRIPDGVEVEVHELRAVKNLPLALNHAMHRSDAKYKVYLQDYLFIVNPNFIEEVIKRFESSPELGIMGMVGTNHPSLTGKVFESYQLVGNIIEREAGTIQLKRFNGEFTKPIKLLDGKILITQYDLPWREDILTSSEYLGESQSLEFTKSGFKAAVFNQNEDYFFYDPDFIELQDLSEPVQGKFLSEYYSLLFPKVSVLIPTYNRPYYFEQALQSVLTQTYKHVEIIVCDDSTNDETQKLIDYYTQIYPNIVYKKNPKNLGQFNNDLQCMELSSGDFINFLMDDDLFHPQKIEKMMAYYMQDINDEVNLITSHRHLIDAEGNILHNRKVTKRAFEQDTLLNGIEFADYALKYNWNFIGEPTTVLFRKSALNSPFGTFCGREYGCNVDMATWLTLLSEGKAIYISETLSYFREHSNQQLQSNLMKLMGATDYAHEILAAPSKGYLSQLEDLLYAMEFCFEYSSKTFDSLDEVYINHPIYSELNQYILQLKLKYSETLIKQRQHYKEELERVEQLLSKFEENEKISDEYGRLLMLYEILSIKIDMYESDRNRGTQSAINEESRKI
ncbi:hypothetical protein J53TS2_10110 [Paenibacillus sp. J53TS2]|uniref:glycosyltransferase n=1 Tax=Paenibacillus sp. J53TS2 TaxID=2807197 RepID=UPI001B011DE0|nr:glycosyltransferase [Paenibacillus sp. J53TS2]GIP47420.1 hypothetical protein J53TS2_10110 [Paenibacillus sp. J53TS2]